MKVYHPPNWPGNDFLLGYKGSEFLDLRPSQSPMFNTHGNDYLMTVNNLSVGLNMPAALKGEAMHQLPPYHRRRAFLVDEYPACPESWMRSSGRIKSYFVAVIPGNGLWLDFNPNAGHTNHQAIVISVQGVNAITGLPCKDPQLEQYRDECPKHKTAFGADRLCKECGFKWPKQNYLSSTGQPTGQLWLDGFRAEDGVIRQYVFSEQAVRGVANAIIGEERVFALGISFFLSQQPRPQEPRTLGRGIASAGMMNYCGGIETKMMDMSLDDCGGDISYTASASMSKSLCSDSGAKGLTKGSSGLMSRSRSFGSSLSSLMHAPVPQVKKLEVAAGAKIDQRIYDDPNGLEFWQKEPEGLVVINYCTEEDARRIIEAGKVDVKGSPEGFLTNVPVGNP